MKKKLFLLSSLCLLLSACGNSNTPADADNTGRNVRDRSEQTMTSGDQSESASDRTITQKIRQALMDNHSLSTNAKNIKIMTVNGVVTLRGPINSDQEKNEIGRLAKSVMGVRSVDNQLEIIRTHANDR